MKIFDYYFYLCSKYMDIGNDGISLLSGAGGFGIWLGVTFMMILAIPSTTIQVLLVGDDGRTITIPSICIIVLSIIMSYCYYKKNDKWKKIVKYYEQKKIRCEVLIFIVYQVFMYTISILILPFLIKQIIKLCS